MDKLGEPAVAKTGCGSQLGSGGGKLVWLVSWQRVGSPDDAFARREVHRGVAQLAEHWFPKPAVAGSSPSAPACKLEFYGWVGCEAV